MSKRRRSRVGQEGRALALEAGTVLRPTRAALWILLGGALILGRLEAAGSEDPTTPTTAPASPSPDPVTGPEIRALTEIDRLGLSKESLDVLLSSVRSSGSTTGSEAQGEDRARRLLEWRALLELRESLQPLGALQEELGTRRGEAREKLKLISASPSAATTAGAIQPTTDDLALQEQQLELEQQQLQSRAAERNVALQSYQSARARDPVVTSVTSPGTTTSSRLEQVVDDPLLLSRAQLEVADLQLERLRELHESRRSLVVSLRELLSAAANVRAVTAEDLQQREVEHDAVARGAREDQQRARDTIQKAELEQKRAEKKQELAMRRVETAAEPAAKLVAELEQRLAQRSADRARTLKNLGQLQVDRAAAQLLHTEKDLLLYRTLHGLGEGLQSQAELTELLRKIREEQQSILLQEKALDLRQKQLTAERLELSRASAASAQRTFEAREAVSREQAELVRQEQEVIRDHSVQLDQCILTLGETLRDLKASVAALESLESRLGWELGQEGLLQSRSGGFDPEGLRMAGRDLIRVSASPEILVRPVKDWIETVSEFLTRSLSRNLLVLLILAGLVGVFLEVAAHRLIRQVLPRVQKEVGPATTTFLHVTGITLLWLPLLLTLLAGVGFVPLAATGFRVLLGIATPWCVAHLLVVFALRYSLVSVGIRRGGDPRPQSVSGFSFLDLLAGRPELEAEEAERRARRRIERALILSLVISCLVLPVYLTMRTLLYNPGLSSLVWLVYEMLIAALMFRGLAWRAMITRLEYERGEESLGAVILVTALRWWTFLLFFSIPLLELLGYSALARFMFTRSGLSILLVAVSRLCLATVLELWQWSRIIPDSLEDVEEDESEDDSTRTLAGLVTSMLHLVLSVTTALAFCWIWGGSATTISLIREKLGTGFNVLGFEVSVLAVAQAALSLWLATWVSRFAILFLEQRVYPRTRLDTGLRYALTQSLHYGLLGVGLLLAFEALGGGLEGLKWFAGFAGIGLGFGMQNIIQNFISGLILLFERPVRIGDIVEVGGVYGTVQRISVRSTVVRKPSNVDVIVPNSSMLTENVTNWTLDTKKVRLEIPVGVAYGSDIEKTRDILLRISRQHPRVLRRPAPQVLFEKLGESSLDFILLLWLQDPMQRRETQSEILFAVVHNLAAEGIEIPIPQRDLHLKTAAPLRVNVVPAREVEAPEKASRADEDP